MINPNDAKKLLEELEDDNRDLFFYSGAITRNSVNKFIPVLLNAKARNRLNASLVLTTPGGNAHHAYRLARLLQDLYDGFRIVVEGPCKSAGTLVAIGAKELAMSPFGELGPLDVQVAKRDEIVAMASGLDTLGALAIVQTEAFNAFESYMVSIVKRSGSSVSTKTACDISAALVSGLFSPIASQIDPHLLSEVDRMMDIAKAYAERLGSPNLRTDDALQSLIGDYPTHEFIIDRKEADTIFSVVLHPTEPETAVVSLFGRLVMEPSATGGAVIHDVVEKLEVIRELGAAKERSETHESGLDRPESGAEENQPETP